MKQIKKMIISLLCEVGKSGVGKSSSWGIYEVKVPNELMKDPDREGDKNLKCKN